MTALDIQPHSRRITHRAVLGLSALAAVAFISGVVRQLSPDPSLFPVSSPADHNYTGPPEATPAPALQVAAPEPVARQAPAAARDDDDADEAPAVAAPTTEAAAPPVDVTAAIPDQPATATPAPAPAPDPEAAPPT
jgi:nicotinate-nucleotide--dimethylbenzimidazole phosphoribosyltransferase